MTSTYSEILLGIVTLFAVITGAFAAHHASAGFDVEFRLPAQDYTDVYTDNFDAVGTLENMTSKRGRMYPTDYGERGQFQSDNLSVQIPSNFTSVAFDAFVPDATSINASVEVNGSRQTWELEDGTNTFDVDFSGDSYTWNVSSIAESSPEALIDGFEDGDYTSGTVWTEVPGKSAGTAKVITDNQGEVYSGQYSLRLRTAGNGQLERISLENDAYTSVQAVSNVTLSTWTYADTPSEPGQSGFAVTNPSYTEYVELSTNDTCFAYEYPGGSGCIAPDEGGTGRGSFLQETSVSGGSPDTTEIAHHADNYYIVSNADDSLYVLDESWNVVNTVDVSSETGGDNMNGVAADSDHVYILEDSSGDVHRYQRSDLSYVDTNQYGLTNSYESMAYNDATDNLIIVGYSISPATVYQVDAGTMTLQSSSWSIGTSGTNIGASDDGDIWEQDTDNPHTYRVYDGYGGSQTDETAFENPNNLPDGNYGFAINDDKLVEEYSDFNGNSVGEWVAYASSTVRTDWYKYNVRVDKSADEYDISIQNSTGLYVGNATAPIVGDPTSLTRLELFGLDTTADKQNSYFDNVRYDVDYNLPAIDEARFSYVRDEIRDSEYGFIEENIDTLYIGILLLVVFGYLMAIER